jgi:hypothetical protein
MTLRPADTAPDFAAAHLCLAAKAALTSSGEPQTQLPLQPEQHRTDRRGTIRQPGRRQDDPRYPASREDYCDRR